MRRWGICEVLMKKRLSQLLLVAAVFTAGSLTVSLQSAEACKGNSCKQCASKDGKKHKNCHCENCQHHGPEGKKAAETGEKKAS